MSDHDWRSFILMRRVGLIIYDVYCLIKMRARACQKKCWVVGLLFTDYRHYFFLSDPIKVFLKNLSLNMYPELVSAWACLSFRQLGIVSFLCPFCILSVSFLYPFCILCPIPDHSPRMLETAKLLLPTQRDGFGAGWSPGGWRSVALFIPLTSYTLLYSQVAWKGIGESSLLSWLI